MNDRTESKSPRLTLIGIFFLLSLPFINRPLFVDDHAAFSDALDISHRGWTPFRSADGPGGWIKGNTPSEFNPPLYSYMIGAVASVAGGEPWKSHVFLLLVQLLGALSLFKFSRRLVDDPLWASVAVLSTIHYWITNSSLLIDSLLAPFFIMTLEAFASACNERKLLSWLLAAALLLMTPLIKYTGLLIWPVAGAWWLLFHRKRPALLLMFLPAAIGFALWMRWTKSEFGQSHLVASAHFGFTLPTLFKTLQFAAFVSGTTPLLAAAAVLIPPSHRKKAPISGLIFLSVTLLGLLGGFSNSVNLALGVLAGVSAVALYHAGSTLGWRDEKNIFLYLWVTGAVVGLLFSIPWICGRFLVIVTPALILMTQRSLEKNYPDLWRGSLKKWVLLAPCFIFSLAVVDADYSQASVDAQLTREIYRLPLQTQKPAHYYYPGALLSGLSFDLVGSAWEPLAPGALVPQGAYLIVPRYGLPAPFLPKLTHPRLVTHWAFPSINPLRTYGSGHAAGYYGSIWGPLPFSWDHAPLEEYILIQENS